MTCHSAACLGLAAAVTGVGVLSSAQDVDPSPRRDEAQLPHRMHSAMEHVPRVRVGCDEGRRWTSYYRVDCGGLSASLAC